MRSKADEIDGVIDVQSGESEEEVMGEGIGEQEMEELVPEWGLRSRWAEVGMFSVSWPIFRFCGLNHIFGMGETRKFPIWFSDW